MQKLACMLVYPMGIQIYDQVSILRSWSKVKLHRAVLLGFVLKVRKIALNIVKFVVHFYLSNRHPNLWSNFNSKKLVRSALLHLISKKLEKSATFCASVWLSLTRVQNNSKSLEVLYAWLSLEWVPKFSFKIQLRESQKNIIS